MISTSPGFSVSGGCFSTKWPITVGTTLKSGSCNRGMREHTRLGVKHSATEVDILSPTACRRCEAGQSRLVDDRNMRFHKIWIVTGSGCID